MYISNETKKAVVLSVLITAIVSSVSTLAWQRSIDTDSVLRWTDEAVHLFPMENPEHFAGVDTLGMRLEKVRVGTPAFHTSPRDPVYGLYRVLYMGDRGIRGYGEAGTLGKAVKMAAENYRQLQKERGK
ncbi:MAG: hypothetical protein HGA33_02990 [Candidatus Moranbacteria bacterium]|nr:hypothetical protein [Candidatus Moranbacteria bacterium]